MRLAVEDLEKRSSREDVRAIVRLRDGEGELAEDVGEMVSDVAGRLLPAASQLE